MSRKALIVIDAQQSFRHSTYWSENDLPAYLEKQQALIDGCVQQGIPVVQVFHVEEQGHFSMASGNVRTLSGLSINPDLIIHKRHHSAFAGTPLAARLTQMGVTSLIISGIRTEQCCETTTRHGSDSGFSVDFVSEATLTFPMAYSRSGRVYSAAEIRECTELVLEDRFARIVTVAEALER
ncbi:isochorismatase family protein [Pseudomonas tolaasii]|uniref:Isochorismatase family protein n=3 Tax=Gammaproteobacteria TaxID=1236 RepID=A0A7Y8AKK2_PSETO|nr:isochorismatase family protein [Pseudomonas tolaasii]ARB29368.1 hydrolase [Pseudomonas tolaasii]KAB0478075.1 isochorismatase family protein [Pseudomonas tolaasii]MBY8940537.1 isochorismatase family protein [Pseudomonas tolaasii]NWC20284.1 isochorismatase family protein [Pseudomonas tolaasii]NWC38286.1 isochorismatase family protein [Pseudomonas tolaasii]